MALLTFSASDSRRSGRAPRHSPQSGKIATLRVNLHHLIFQQYQMAVPSNVHRVRRCLPHKSFHGVASVRRPGARSRSCRRIEKNIASSLPPMVTMESSLSKSAERIRAAKSERQLRVTVTTGSNVGIISLRM